MAYNPKTGKGLGRYYDAEHRAFRAREWRGFKDTFYDFFRWLYLYGFMAVKLGCHPILMVKSMLRYRWMVSYLTAALLRIHSCKIPRDGRSPGGGIAGVKITHMNCIPFLIFPHLTLFFLFGQLSSAKIDFLFDFPVDKNECSIYNHDRTEVLTIRRNHSWPLLRSSLFSSASALSPPR